ncbi:MAG: GAF domain-containing sensor histidine kinase [Ardenticatenaceae bacterium]|nr:GAF domain-containing sensor histidine kinase [Anaerolineales bacterium]MCB8975944.1 GAF domain-containing sensor histidine kinase [Ardenticatenaceae bacterium]
MSLDEHARQLQRRNAELSILNSMAQALNRSMDLGQTLHAILAQVAELLDLQTGWVWLLRDDDGQSYLAAAQNLPPALAHNPQKMEGSCYCLDTYRDGDLAGAANVNVVTCSRLKNLVDGTDGLRYHASIPLYAHSKKLGVLNVASTDWRELSPDDLQLLYTVGDMLGIAVERARLFERSAEVGAVEERNRLAREIHDTLAQGLTAVSLQLESADALLEAGADPARVRQMVQQALLLTRGNLEEARRSVLDLRAAPLAGRTLVEALAVLAAEAPLPIDLLVTGGSQPLPPRVEIGLYRLAQEAINNACQHAQASQIVVKLVATPHVVTLTVEDNGCGFELADVADGRFGLVGLNERVKLLNGRFHIESTPGKGTKLQAELPLN